MTGLGWIGDLQGLPCCYPWINFEAWVETIVEQYAKRNGWIIKTGRKRDTVTPLSWSPAYLGSQRYLLPDIILEREQETFIFDAKYKRPLGELNREGWSGLDKVLQEQHRSDLTGSGLLNCIGKQAGGLLPAYPCRPHTWYSLKRRQPFTKHRSARRPPG